MVNSFSGGGSRSTRREPSTMGKQLVNFYHLQLRVECTLLCTKKLMHKPNSGLDLVVRKPKIQKVKEKKKKIIIKVENIGPNKKWCVLKW
jgi:hypothetical protein